MTLLDNDAFSTQDIEPIEIAKFCDVCDKLDTIYSLFDELFRRENHELVFLEIQHIYKIISSAKQIPLTPLFLSCNIPSHLITLLEVTDPQFFLWTATLIMSYSRFPDHFVLFLRNGLIEKIIPISLHITDEDFRYGPIVDMIEFISGFSSYECEHLFSICPFDSIFRPELALVGTTTLLRIIYNYTLIPSSLKFIDLIVATCFIAFDHRKMDDMSLAFWTIHQLLRFEQFPTSRALKFIPLAKKYILREPSTSKLRQVVNGAIVLMHSFLSRPDSDCSQYYINILEGAFFRIFDSDQPSKASMIISLILQRNPELTQFFLEPLLYIEEKIPPWKICMLRYEDVNIKVNSKDHIAIILSQIIEVSDSDTILNICQAGAIDAVFQPSLVSSNEATVMFSLRALDKIDTILHSNPDVLNNMRELEDEITDCESIDDEEIQGLVQKLRASLFEPEE